MGLLNSETKTIYLRANSEMAFALALTHHLYFTNKISFNQIAEILHKFSSKYLIVEFIDIADKRVQELILNNHINQEAYTETNFIESLCKYYTILEVKKLHNSKRSLLFMEKQLSA